LDVSTGDFEEWTLASSEHCNEALNSIGSIEFNYQVWNCDVNNHLAARIFLMESLKKKFNVGNALVRSVGVTVYSEPGVCINIMTISFIPL